MRHKIQDVEWLEYPDPDTSRHCILSRGLDRCKAKCPTLQNRISLNAFCMWCCCEERFELLPSLRFRMETYLITKVWDWIGSQAEEKDRTATNSENPSASLDTFLLFTVYNVHSNTICDTILSKPWAQAAWASTYPVLVHAVRQATINVMAWDTV